MAVRPRPAGRAAAAWIGPAAPSLGPDPGRRQARYFFGQRGGAAFCAASPAALAAGTGAGAGAFFAFLVSLLPRCCPLGIAISSEVHEPYCRRPQALVSSRVAQA